MNDQIIIELRGNGLVMILYEIDNDTLELLKAKAKQIGEDLSQLWFDPFFWRPKELNELKLKLKNVGEYRGLLNDDISFVEIRRNGKQRKKYLVKQLLGEGLLFPLVGLSPFQPIEAHSGKSIIAQILIGTGSLAKYKLINRTQFDLSELEFWSFKSFTPNYILLPKIGVNVLHYISDDFLIREHELCIY